MLETAPMFREILCCPACKGELLPEVGGALPCADARCGKSYPVVAGRPVLIAEDRSVFHHRDYQREPAPPAPAESGSAATEGGGAKARLWLSRLPSPSVNLSAVRCFETMKRRLLERTAAPLVLLVGGGIRGKGMSALTGEPAIRLINVDPSPNSTASVFCDAHDLPFRDGSVDAVVAQAVLEHVADPWRCVEEIHRVLKPDGIVYAETPFMQEVHLQGYDFTRFSHMGHRRLFRRFAEIESGAVAGPGTTLAWAWRYFLASWTRSRRLAKVLAVLGRITAFVFELTDHIAGQRPGALDAASCIFFLGTRSEAVVSDRELIAGYRGTQR
ncbi:MAG TPA: methyltransferase domain-containing protein [Polyangia bacterium]|jgi:SAM-dependent methyltransferase